MNLSVLTSTFYVKNHLFCFISSSHHHAAVLSFSRLESFENFGVVFSSGDKERGLGTMLSMPDRLLSPSTSVEINMDNEIKASQTLGIIRLCSCSLEFGHENFWEPLVRLDHQSWIFYFPENERHTWRSLFNASVLLWLSRSSNAAFKTWIHWTETVDGQWVASLLTAIKNTTSLFLDLNTTKYQSVRGLSSSSR